MNPIRSLSTSLFPWPSLARGDKNFLADWIAEDTVQQRLAFCLASIFIGGGCYGAAIGAWHSLEMAAYVAIKLPLIIVVTFGLNGLINGMIATLVGADLSLRQTWLSILSAFSIFSLVLLSLSPVTLYFTLNLPGPDAPPPAAAKAHQLLLIGHVIVLGLSGIAAMQRLWRLLISKTERPFFLIALWIFSNGFVGAQIAYLFRPIFGTPGLKIAFLRPDAFDGNFYESLLWAMEHCLK